MTIMQQTWVACGCVPTVSKVRVCGHGLRPRVNADSCLCAQRCCSLQYVVRWLVALYRPKW